MDRIYVNKKNGKKYLVLGNVINCTNVQDGQKMILYKSTEIGDDEVKYFVREEEEFFNKFYKFGE